MLTVAKAALWRLFWLGSLAYLLPGSLEQIAVSESTALARCPELVDIIGVEDWHASLVNPVIRTLPEVAETALRYRRTLDCLASVDWPRNPPDWVSLVTYHLDLFLTFADPSPGEDPSRVSVDFRRISDPAVERLREELGLAPPEGFIFVRYFASLGEMPPGIRNAFRDPETRAVTLGARYVAVLSPAPGNSTGNRLIEDSLETTLSHELVHAFLNARLDWGPEGKRFPSWFHEGMAIYFSDSGRAHVTLDPPNGQLFRVEPTVEYEQYERVFRFVESELGREAFHAVLREAVEDVDASRVPASAGMDSYEDLHLRAERWWRWWPVPVRWTSGPRMVILAGLSLLGLTLVWRVWRRWQPAISGSALEVELNRDLGAAVREGDLGEVRDLLRSGADPNAVDSGRPVLEWAVWLDDIAIAEALLESGASSTPEIERIADLQSESGTMLRVLADAALRNEIEED